MALPAAVVDARDYGVVANDATDDTSALQNAVNAAGTGTVLVPGVCKITSPIDIPVGANGLTIQGAGLAVSGIKQYTANTPIVRAKNMPTYGVTLADMTLSYNSQQTTSDTDAFGIQFSSAGTVTSNSHYFWNLERLRVDKAYIGIGCRTADTLTIATWGHHWDAIWISDYAYRGVSIDSPVSTGMPGNVANRVYILAQNTTPTSYAWYSQYAEWVINGLDIELGGSNTGYRPIYVATLDVLINGLHIEHWNTTEDNAVLIELAAGEVLRIDGFLLESTTINNSGTAAAIFKTAAASRLIVDNMSVSAVTLTAGTLDAFATSASTGSVWLRGWRDASGNVTPGSLSHIRDFQKVGVPVQTFTDADTTPSVWGFYKFKTANTGSTTITTFDDGHPGQEIVIIFTDANTTIAETGNIKLSAAFTSTAADTMKLIYDGTSWYELSRSVN